MTHNEYIPEIPGYKIDRKLGKGGMANVYLGIQEVLGRKVAIKILFPEMASKEHVVRRFLNEARTASRLQHPNIVTIHDVGQLGDTCYIVMEYLQESLINRIKTGEGGKMDPTDAFRTLQQMAKALTYAHNEGFIHRDIKPDNILFRKDNMPVLADFGIARAIEQETRLTTDGMIIGTPQYMSPEQCRGETVNGQSDIYSLGIVFYEMLTGKVPFKADSAAGILVKHIQEPAPPLPHPLEKYQPLLDRMVAKSKEDRIASGIDLLQAAANFFPGSRLNTIETSKPETWVFDSTGDPHDGTRDTQNKRGPTMVLSDPPPTVPSSRQPKKRRLWPLLLVLFLLAGGGAAYYFLMYLPGLETSASKQPHRSQQQPEIVNERPIATPQSRPPSPKMTQTTGTTAPRPETGTAINNDTSAAVSDPTPDPKSMEYEKHLLMAEEYFKDGEIEKSLAKLDQAATLKQTDQEQGLRQKINELLAHQKQQEKEKEFKGYFDKAGALFKKGDYKGAEKQIQLARGTGVAAEGTPPAAALETLTQQVHQKIEAARRKVRQEKKRQKADDDAFRRARGRNTVYAYEKYLEKHPRGDHADEAQKRLEELKGAIQLENKIQDDVAYEAASSNGTIAAYQDYLKRFPFGSHSAQAQTAIRELKEKIIRDTQIKIQITGIQFFESGVKASAMGKRSYQKRFPATTTRYIFTEISYRNKMYGIIDASNRVMLEYRGSDETFKIQVKGLINTTSDAQDGFYWRGMGWTEAGKWQPGTYTVTVYVDGKELDKADFEIYAAPVNEPTDSH